MLQIQSRALRSFVTPAQIFPTRGNYIWPVHYGNIKVSRGRCMTYIRSCIDESSGTSDVVSKAGLVKRRHMVYGQNVHIVTLENQSSSRAAETFSGFNEHQPGLVSDNKFQKRRKYLQSCS